jgi:hypothetical protein
MHGPNFRGSVLKSDPVESIGRLKAEETESWVGRTWRQALYTRSSPFYVGDGRTDADNQLEGKAWCRWDDELLAWRRALHTRSTLFYVGVGRTSVAPSILHTLFSSVTW